MNQKFIYSTSINKKKLFPHIDPIINFSFWYSEMEQLISPLSIIISRKYYFHAILQKIFGEIIRVEIFNNLVIYLKPDAVVFNELWDVLFYHMRNIHNSDNFTLHSKFSGYWLQNAVRQKMWFLCRTGLVLSVLKRNLQFSFEFQNELKKTLNIKLIRSWIYRRNECIIEGQITYDVELTTNLLFMFRKIKSNKVQL